MKTSRAKNELPIPEVAKRDKNSAELLRVWVAENQQHVILRTDAWEDPAAWGMVLYDLAWHVANAYAANRNEDAAKIMQRIREGLNAELSQLDAERMATTE